MLKVKQFFMSQIQFEKVLKKELHEVQIFGWSFQHCEHDPYLKFKKVNKGNLFLESECCSWTVSGLASGRDEF
jgi:hypothetical protein